MLKRVKTINMFILLLVFLISITGCNLNEDTKRSSDDNIIEFEDSKFMEALLDNGVDINGDNQISRYEVESYDDILDLSKKQIKSIEGIQFFTKVKILNLSFNSLQNLTALADMKWLTSLDISYNNIEDISALINSTNLIMLDLSSNKISEIDDISNLTGLKFLGLSNNNVSNIDVIGRLSNITYLLLDSNDIDNIASLKELQNLRELWINNTSVSSIPNELLHKLKKINISNTQVKKDTIKEGITEIIE